MDKVQVDFAIPNSIRTVLGFDAKIPDIPPGGKIIVEPRVLIYLPVSVSVISRLTSWLMDQNNEPLNLQGEELTIKYHLRRCIKP